MNKEVQFVTELVKNYPRHPHQKNRVFESDAEIVELPQGFLVASLDTVAEEILLHLIRDPQTLGWLTVTASLSDLAACGVAAQNVSVHVGVPAGHSEKSLRQFRQGAEAAAADAGAVVSEFVSFEAERWIASCAAVSLEKERPAFRRGPLHAGDRLYLSGPIGWGNATAFANVALSAQAPDVADGIDRQYRPKARVKEALFLRSWANACIDTSDGLLFTLDLWKLLSGKGLRLVEANTLFHPVAVQVAAAAKVPPWLFLAGQNGEFELLFSVPAAKATAFEQAAASAGFSFLRAGEVIETPKVELSVNGVFKNADLGPIRNLLHDGVAPKNYIHALLGFAEGLGIR